MASEEIDLLRNDPRYVPNFREFVKQAVKNPNLQPYRKEATKLLHMNDRQLAQNIKMYGFMYWAMYKARENLRRDRMTPVRAMSDDGEAEAS